MPMKKVSCRNDKAVLVRVYVEKPRKKRSSIQHHHHRHFHDHIHHTVRQKEVVHHGSESDDKGYDRKAGLLKYSNLLRDSARGASSTPSFSKRVVANNNVHSSTQITPSKKKKPDDGEKPTCFGIWKLLIPSFLRCWSKAQNKEKKEKHMRGGVTRNGTKTLQVWRGKGKSFITNVFSTTRKLA